MKFLPTVVLRVKLNHAHCWGAMSILVIALMLDWREGFANL